MVDQARRSQLSFPLFAALVALLIGTFLWRLLARAGSWPMPPFHYISMALDLAMLVIMVLLYMRLSAAAPDAGSRSALVRALMIAAVISGIGILLLRFNGDVGWWTGHLRNWSD